MNQNSQTNNSLTLLSNAFSNLSSDQQIALTKATASAVTSTLQSTLKVVEIIAEGHRYRNILQSMIKALETDQTMRHNDVKMLIEVYREFSPSMPQHIRDQYLISILKLLESPRQKLTLPHPR